MRLQIAFVSARRDRPKSQAAQELVQDYVARANRLAPTAVQSFRSEQDLLTFASRRAGRTAPYLILLDSRGQSFTSEKFAANLRTLRDAGTQELFFAIGPPDGWSGAAHTLANQQLSFGPMTLPHELALVVLAEQIYRALTILAGHPYHSGHE